MSAEPVVRRTVAIVNRLGLHARAATLFVLEAQKFTCSVSVTKDGETVDGKSILGLMMLQGGQGSSIDIEACGADAEQALAALARLVEERFTEPD